MYQAAQPTVQPNFSQIPNSNAEQNFSNNGSKKMRVIIYLLIFLSLILGVGGYFLGAFFGSKSSLNTMLNDKSDSSGYRKFQELVKEGDALVFESIFQLTYQGTLTATEPNKSWTLNIGDKSVIIKHEGDNAVNYRLLASRNAPPQPASSDDIKIGDYVTVLTYVNPDSGDVSVKALTVVRPPSPPSEATTGASL